MALLEADVALPVVKDFIARVKEKALGEEVIGSLTPGQALVGRGASRADRADGRRERRARPRGRAAGGDPDGRAAGLGQDHDRRQAREAAARRRCARSRCSCRATSTGRRRSSSSRRSPAQVGRRLLPVGGRARSRSTSRARALEHARTHYNDVLIVDTAGRLGDRRADDEGDRRAARGARARPRRCSSSTRCRARTRSTSRRRSASALPLTGVILTKLDGDARGGAALSVRQRHRQADQVRRRRREARRRSSRSIPSAWPRASSAWATSLSLVEEARKGVDQVEAEKLAEKIKKGKGFDLEDFKGQIQQMKKMGGLASLVDKLPAQFAQAAAGRRSSRTTARCGGSRASSTR